MKNEELFQNYRKFALKKANQWWYTNAHWAYHLMDCDDCCCEALIVLYKAADTFRNEPGVKFASYAGLLIERHFIDIFNKYGEDSKTTLLSLPMNTSSKAWASHQYRGVGSLANTYESIISDDEDFLSDIEMHESFFQFYAQCRETDQKIIFLLWQHVPVIECAKRMKMTQPAISLRRKHLLKAYREFVAV